MNATTTATRCPAWCTAPGNGPGHTHISRDVSLPLFLRDGTAAPPGVPVDLLDAWPHVIAELVEDHADLPGRGPVVQIGTFTIFTDDETFLTLDDAERLARGILALVEAGKTQVTR